MNRFDGVVRFLSFFSFLFVMHGKEFLISFFFFLSSSLSRSIYGFAKNGYFYIGSIAVHFPTLICAEAVDVANLCLT